MDLLQTIDERLLAEPLPLVAVTVAAVAHPDTPVILTLHWHGFVEEGVSADGNESRALKPLPSVALQINDRWNELTELDRAAVEAGWELGAWDVARSERTGCARPGADSSETLECLQAFGASAQTYGNAPVVLTDAPDIDDLVNMATRCGYLLWKFRPVYHGLCARFANDSTLTAEGRRKPTCPVELVIPTGTEAVDTVYRLGLPVDASWSN
ncbi:MAG: diguanylate cyclase [Betaproteobacteria bacterium]